MVAQIFVAAGVLLFAAISAPASAQQQQFYQPGKQPPPQPGQKFFPGTNPPTPSRPPGPPHTPGQVLQQPIYPQFVYPPFVGLCVVPDVGSCEVFRAPGSYCECKNSIGEVFSGVVE
jgi:hypothetical protein